MSEVKIREDGRYSAERLAEISASHGMDGGGYEYENPEQPELRGVGVVVWEDPDWDYISGDDLSVDEHGVAGDFPVFAFRPTGPYGGSVDWPAELEVEGEPRQYMVLVGQGHLNETERACDCHGAWDPTLYKIWSYSGDDEDEPHPDCPKCEGCGYATSEGGPWAVYVQREREVAPLLPREITGLMAKVWNAERPGANRTKIADLNADETKVAEDLRRRGWIDTYSWGGERLELTDAGITALGMADQFADAIIDDDWTREGLPYPDRSPTAGEVGYY